MKIAQIAPLAESVPVVSYLTEELVRLGHEVERFAAGDSAAGMEELRRRAHEFDVLHFHAGHIHFPLFRDLARKTVTTLHGRLELSGMPALLEEFREMPLVSVSNAQRAQAPQANWVATVYPGLPAEVCPLNPAAPRGAARYLALLGRVSPEEGLEQAIEIALRSGVALRIVPKLDEAAKPAFLGNASALLLPECPEPFCLAMIEAMSCGTPVIAWPHGAAAEVVEDGVTGFVVRSVAEAVRAAAEAVRLDRTRVRARFDQRFSAERMTRDYLAVYRVPGRARAPRAVAPA